MSSETARRQKRYSRKAALMTPGVPLPQPEVVPDPSSSDYEGDDSLVLLSDEGEAETVEPDASRVNRRALSPNVIDESLILSDEEEDHQVYDDANDADANSMLVHSQSHDDDEEEEEDARAQGDGGKSGKKRMWTRRTKKNYANPGTAATSALMVEDKPWRNRSKNRGTTNSDTPAPKSPGRVAQLFSKPVSSLPSPTLEPGSTSSPGDGNPRRPLLKNIMKGFGSGNPQAAPSPRRSRGAVEDSTSANNAAVWSDDNDDDQYSISSEMISYSSMESNGLDDDFSFYVEDYTHNPELEFGFWNELPYLPNHFVFDDQGAEDVSSMLASHINTGSLPYLDPKLKAQTLSDPSKMNDFMFVLDHRFFLRALFHLLAERDEVGVEDSIHDDENIIKKGPLRKKYVGIVKVKYLELRKGNLTYFGDGDGEGRKTIHLRAATASCNAIDEPSSASAEADGDQKEVSTTMASSFSAAQASTIGQTGMHAAAQLSAGLTNAAVNATTSAASAISGGSSYVPGFEFHLWVEGKRYAWLANSKSEQLSWVRAIRQAMIGDNVYNDDWGVTLNAGASDGHDDLRSTHEDALAAYHSLQTRLQEATTTEEYSEAIVSIIKQQKVPSLSPALQVPLKALCDQTLRERVDPRKDGTSQQRRVKTSIAEFWYNMGQFDFAINGHIVDRGSPYAAERIIGSLVRCILDFDRCFSANVEPPPMPSLSEAPGHSVYDNNQENKRIETDRISELDAVSYARNILLLILKSKISGDVEFAVDSLLKNEDLVRVAHDPPTSLSTSSETLHIDVSFAGDDVIDHNDEVVLANEASGWVMVRRSKYNTWKKRFCVFSEGVFSYYENAKPRPHGLRGQLLLAGATISEVDDEKDRAREDSGLYILRLNTKGQERERQFGFKSKEEFLEWKAAIQHVVDSCIKPQGQSEGESEGVSDGSGRNKKTMSIIEGGTKLMDGGIKAIKGATGGGMKVVKGGTKVIRDATGGGVKAIKGATSLMFRSIRSSRSSSKGGDGGVRSLRKSPSLQFLMENTRSEKTGKREPTVQVVIQSTNEYSLHAVDVSKEDVVVDAFVTVRVRFFQAYLLSGGYNGRLARGDAMLEIDFVDEKMDQAHDSDSDDEDLKKR